MSTREATVRNFFNLNLGDLASVTLGATLGGRFRQVLGVKHTGRVADTNVAVATVRAVPVVTHKWAAKVGKYNDDPIWGEIFENIRQNRRRIIEELNDLE
jgi:hypothetical protein